MLLEPPSCILSHMNQTHTQWAAGAFALLVLIAGVFFFWQRTSPVVPAPETATSTVATSSTASTPGYTITEVPAANLPAAPEYQTPLVCASDLNAAACTQMQSEAATVAAQISKNPTNGVAWINLGTIRKINEDYSGAEAAWVYVTELYPKNSIAFSNLGDLYMNFLHDYTKADASYLSAIKDAPTDTSSYKNLFTLYTTTSYKPTATAAENILKEGIAANPKAVDLQVMLARYYTAQGRTADAAAEYSAAIANATAQGQTDLAAQIQAEAAGAGN